MTRISTLQMNNLVVGSAMASQVQYAQAETQQASGLVATDFGTMGGSGTSEMLNLETDIAQAQTWSSDATAVGNRTQAMYTAIGNMVTTVNSLQSKISGAMASSDNSTLYAAVSTLQQTLVSEMNTTSAAGYVFSGSNSTTQPVTAAGLAAYQAGGTATNYYNGDDTVLSVRVSSSQTVNYGVTADNPAFEEAMRAMQATSDAAAGTVAQGTATAASPTAATDPTVVTGGTIIINGTGAGVTVAAGESLQSVATGINSAYGPSVSAKVVYTGSAYTLQVSSAGTAALNISDTSGLGLPSSTTYTSSLQSALKSALTVANNSVRDLSNLQESVAATSSQLQSASTQQSTYVTYLQNSLSNVKDVDTAQAAANVTKYQTQLQASYLAVAQISKINLAQYL